LRRIDQLGVAGQRHDLNLAGTLEAEQHVERGRNGAADHQQAVVAQDHGFVVAKVSHQTLALVDIVGDAFEVVVGDVEKSHRGLRQRQQPAFHGRDGHAGGRVRMRHAIHVVLGHVDGAVNDEAGDVDVIVGGIEQRVALDVDLDQAGGVDLLVKHPVGVDQELVSRPGHPAGDVVGDHLGHPVHRREAVAGCKIDARLPFLRGHLFADRFYDLDRGRTDGRIHSVSPRNGLSGRAGLGHRKPRYLQNSLRRKAGTFSAIVGRAGEIRMRYGGIREERHDGRGAAENCRRALGACSSFATSLQRWTRTAGARCCPCWSARSVGSI
jgi:hypothetical protein